MAKSSKKIPKTFFSFLAISALIWLLITFSKEYKTVINYPVKYTKIAQDKLLQETPIKKIDVAIKASGFKILRAKISQKTIELDASKLNRKNSSKFYFLIDNQRSKIQKQLLTGVELQEIIQDTIYLNLGLLTSKKIALKPNLEIDYHIGYDLLDEITLKPDSIIVSGPESQIAKINYLNLKKLTLTDVKSNFKEQVNIQKPEKSKNLKFNTTISTIYGKVDKFTEGKLQVPITIKNLPPNTNITTLTKNVEVGFVVALSNFVKVSETSFKIECDYRFSEKNNLDYLIPKVVAKPDFVKSFKINPTKIDFLIQK
ncbi:CdaR family protein [Polaribacter sp.]|uniref:CdaR family protein n=1 Tax=Polaribacter sp. TaxID=1920175 RepID=UPI003F6B9B7C